MFLEMKVRGLALDPLSNMPINILKDEEDKRSLPIWVGISEANAIALEIEKIATPRPMTHDLIKNILESVQARVTKDAEPIKADDPDRIKEWLGSIKPEDFEKFNKA